MAESIESGTHDNPPTLTFYIRSTKVRQSLKPDIKDGKPGYWCSSTPASRPHSQDTVLKSATEWEKTLVRMKLMKSTSGSRIVAVLPIWSHGMDRLQGVMNTIMHSVASGEERWTAPTWLPILK